MAGQPLSQPAPVLDLGTHDDLCLTLLLDSCGIPGGLITKPQRARRPLSPALLKLSLRVFPPNCSSIPLPHDEQVGDEHCRKSPTRGTVDCPFKAEAASRKEKIAPPVSGDLCPQSPACCEIGHEQVTNPGPSLYDRWSLRAVFHVPDASHDRVQRCLQPT